MKKPLLFILAFSCFITTLKAQGPTLTSANNTPVIGENFLNQFAQTANVSTYNGGASQTWNYSSLADSNGIFQLHAVAPVSTPFADSFPNSNLSLVIGNDSAFSYFSSGSTQLSILGVAASDTGIIRYTTPKIYLPYPFSYGSFFTDSVVQVFPKYNITSRGKDSVYGNGYGTLILPQKTYTNVLRVMYIENITYMKDTTITVGLLSFPGTAEVNTRTVSYLYFTPDTHFPLLTIEQTTATFSFVVGGVVLPGFSYSSTSETIFYLKAITLPVSFVSFAASLQNKEIALQWKTAQETNTSHFNVQRSVTGSDFENIDAVTATGYTAGSVYRYTDKSFVKTNVPPTVYYRIQEVDKDGKLFYSGTAVEHGNKTIISLYPNPSNNSIHFTIADATIADAVSIYDVKGHVLKQWSRYQLSQPITISSFSKGTYFIKVTINNKTTTATFIKE